MPKQANNDEIAVKAKRCDDGFLVYYNHRWQILSNDYMNMFEVVGFYSHWWRLYVVLRLRRDA